MTEPPSILQQKRDLRARMRAVRADLGSSQKVRASGAIAGHGLTFLQPLPASIIVSGFASLHEELNVWQLLRRLHAKGFPLALPVVLAKGQPLTFRAWVPGDMMISGVWGIPEPTADKLEVEPDILLVPLLAFDREGRRLGYGGGFFDRTLKALRALKPIIAVGLAFDEQLIDAVPHLDYDQRLDWVLTPSGPIRCAG